MILPPVSELLWIAVSVLLLGMSKGGFPVGSVALPLLILVWPEQPDAARTAVGFMLPVLCVMDVFALAFYRRRVLWRRLLPLFPGMLAGVAAGSLFLVSGESAVIHFSDRTLKFCVGLIGVLFVLYRAASRWLLRRLAAGGAAGAARGTLLGFAAGLTSTVAHAAGPVMQMYLLPQRLPKLEFAGTSAGFFFITNLVKLIPFTWLGRIEAGNLRLAGLMLPLIPAGVAAGYLLVRFMKPRHYEGLIYGVLLATSIVLIMKAGQTP